MPKLLEQRSRQEVNRRVLRCNDVVVRVVHVVLSVLYFEGSHLVIGFWTLFLNFLFIHFIILLTLYLNDLIFAIISIGTICWL